MTIKEITTFLNKRDRVQETLNALFQTYPTDISYRDFLVELRDDVNFILRNLDPKNPVRSMDKAVSTITSKAA